MPGLSIFSGVFCNGSAVKNRIREYTGFHLLTDEQIVTEAAGLSGLGPRQIRQAFSPTTSVFNPFTHEKEYALACLRLSLARHVQKEEVMIWGYSGMLIPKSLSHMLHVCIVAGREFRLSRARNRAGWSEEDAVREIESDTHARSVWTDDLFSNPDPWHADLHDMVIPLDRTDPTRAAVLIAENLKNPTLRMTERSRAAAADFLLAAKVETALIRAGHNVKVTAENGRIRLTITRQVLMLERLEAELTELAGQVAGVNRVETSVETGSEGAAYYRKYQPDMPSKVLLVDDEREFVQTLSERLQIRDMGSAVAFDGGEALEMVRRDDPEVMIIDLKMPGIDGIQVLKEVKQTRPEIEVIVLTGHGSEQDRRTCMELGAFAYFQKPVDIDTLSEALKQAHQKAGAGKADFPEPC